MLASDLDVLGRPFATFRGAQDDEAGVQGSSDAGNDGADHDDAADNTPDADGLTPGGRRALEAEREATKTAKRALSPWRKLERDFQMGPDEIRARLEGKVQDADGETKDAAAIRREAEIEATKKVNARLVRSEVKALATASFADPTDAILFLDFEQIDVDDDGEVDTKEIERQLADILRRKPHLAKKTDTDDVTSFDGGARTTSSAPKSMTQLIREGVAAKNGASSARR